MAALNLSNDEFLNKFSVSLCQKLGVEEQNGVQVIKETVAEFQAIIAEEEARNVCKAVIKAGDNKGQVCGKKFKDGQCPVHKPHSHAPKESVEDNGPKCELILKNGERSGQPCGKKCVENEDRCAVHMRFPTPGNGCTYVFARGDRAGQTCDKKRENDEDAFCLFHKQAHEKSESRKSEPKSEKKAKKEKESNPKEAAKSVSAVSDESSVAAVSDESSVAAVAASSEKSDSTEPKEKKVKKVKSDSTEPKEKKVKKEKSDSKPKEEEKPVYEQMRCVRRGESLAIKGTPIAVNENYQITGYVKNDGSDEEPKWVLVKEYHQGMEEAVKRYGVKCEFKPSSVMLVEDDE